MTTILQHFGIVCIVKENIINLIELYSNTVKDFQAAEHNSPDNWISVLRMVPPNTEIFLKSLLPHEINRY